MCMAPNVFLVVVVIVVGVFALCLLLVCLFVCGLLFGYLLFVYFCLFVYCCFCLFVNWYTMFDGVTRDLFLEQVCVKGLPVVCTDEPCFGLIGRRGKGTSSQDTKTEVITTIHSLMIVYMPKKTKKYSAEKLHKTGLPQQ